MATIQMYERLQKAEDEEIAERAPEERGHEARDARRAATKKNIVFFVLLGTNLITLLIALYLAQKLYRSESCDVGAGQGSTLQGKPLGGVDDVTAADVLAPGDEHQQESSNGNTASLLHIASSRREGITGSWSQTLPAVGLLRNRVMPVQAWQRSEALSGYSTPANGSKVGMLETYDIVTLNTSRIAVDLFNTTSNSSSCSEPQDQGFFTSILHNVTCDIHNATDSVQSDIESALNDVLQSVASDLGLHDFYSVHILDFCEGFYTPPNTTSSTRNVTHCSNATALFAFNATQTLERELARGGLDLDLAQLHWPAAIDHGLRTLRRAFNAVFVLYCIGIGFTGLLLLGSLAALLLSSGARLVALADLVLALLAFVALLVASAVVTYAGGKAADVVNDHGDAVDVNARRGGGFLGLTWAATALVFVAALAWSVECCVGRRRGTAVSKQYH
ncbi:hypothetical protein FH972_025636 [Carpinus fangiana]|uniref:Uncharacterized protein n=1 Tax=Carpinus fangiana TaxID=176857 RepID=A0A5N6L1K7_9ROSI|nr:hypothetical protein FH972_025636 [Carpinus fangiana]